jgi:hypothetical protein
MTLDRLLNLLAAAMGTLGSIYVLHSFLLLSPELTADLATTRWGFSTSIIDSLADQRAESLVGACALVFALLLATVALAFGPFDQPALRRPWQGLMVVVVLVAAAMAALHQLRKALSARHRHRSRVALLTRRFDSFLSGGKFTKAFVEDLAASARVLLGVQIQPEAGPRAVVLAVADAVGRTLAPGLEIPEHYGR